MSDLNQVAQALDRKDYRTAAQLLKTLLQTMPDNVWVQFYVGRLHEENNRPEAAEQVYRQLLQNAANPKLATKVRQSLQRLQDKARTERQAAIAQATATPENSEFGFLALEPIAPDNRDAAIQYFAKFMNLDAYTARLQLPSRGWQLYRTGAIGELRWYGDSLAQGGITTLCASVPEIEAIQILRVSHIQSATSRQATLVCQDEQDQLGSITFRWSEVGQRIEALLPIFEEVLDEGPWGKLQRKHKTQDYARFCDLHLLQRRCILRFCDARYQFQEGFEFTPPTPTAIAPTTTRLAWDQLIAFLNQNLGDTPTNNAFQTFGETSLDYRLPLSQLKHHIDLFRKAETHWDPAFQLYSSLHFLKQWRLVNSEPFHQPPSR